jgi:hypothetical protein
MRSLTKSPVAFAQTALAAARAELPAYSHPKSPHKFTQPQLVAMLALKDFLRTDYRGLIAYLSDWTDLRRALELTCLPNFSTLCYAHQRLLKKRALQN